MKAHRPCALDALVLAALLLGGCERRAEGVASKSGGPGAAAPAKAEAESWLTDTTASYGVDFRHESGAAGALHMPEIMGGGLALFDYDNDGDLDLYFTTGHRGLPQAGAAAEPLNRLYRQDPGPSFVDVTAASGLGDGGYGMGTAVGDFDNDGDEDVYVTNYGPDALYRNRGDGSFENVTAAAGVAVDGWSCSAAFFDYDRDGHLDLYVTRYVEYDPARKCTDRAGRSNYCNPDAFKPVHDVLLHNDGDGSFTDVSAAAGLTAIPPCAGLGVTCADFNGDGWQDVYVANDGDPNQFWINNRNGGFTDLAVVQGAAYNAHGMAEAGMGVVAADLDNDSDLDLFITHLDLETNTFYRNIGGGFEDASTASGLAAKHLPLTGFGTMAFDIELDGDLDIAVVNGRVTRGEPRPGVEQWAPPEWAPYAEPGLLYLNDGQGRFTSGNALAAALCVPMAVGRGLAGGDLDADGDIDLVAASIQGAPRILRNDAPRQGRYLRVRAIDPRLNRAALGARIDVHSGERRWTRILTCASSYLTSHPSEAHFGLGPVSAIDRIEVYWPDGLREGFGPFAPDTAITLQRGDGEALP